MIMIYVFYHFLFLVVNDTDAELEHVFTRLRLHHCLSLAEPAPPELNFEMTKKDRVKMTKKLLENDNNKRRLSENSDFTTAWP